jgi:hypothetical protein
MPQTGHCSWSSAVGASCEGFMSAVGTPLSMPDQIDSMIWPPTARLRKMSRCEVRMNSDNPILDQ